MDGSSVKEAELLVPLEEELALLVVLEAEPTVISPSLRLCFILFNCTA